MFFRSVLNALDADNLAVNAALGNPLSAAFLALIAAVKAASSVEQDPKAVKSPLLRILVCFVVPSP